MWGRWCILGLFCLTSCGGGPRGRVASAIDAEDVPGALSGYEELRQTEGTDLDLLARIATLVLLREVHGDDDVRRRAALTQLSLAGTRGEPILVQLSESPGVTPARLGALGVLARRGHREAQLALRGLGDREDPAILSIVMLGMDPELDRDLLLLHARAEDAGLRAAAVRALRPAASVGSVREALEHIARVDEDAAVRAAAVSSLGAAGGAAVEALRERLGDPASRVRLAAVGALAAVAPEAARETLGPLLEVSVSPAGIEAARLLALQEDAQTASRAREFLSRALSSPEPSLRIQAGVALTGLPRATQAPMRAVREALAREADPAVRLAFARALWRREDPVARQTFEALLRSDGVPQIQAASYLAEQVPEARRVLVRALADTEANPLVRRTAARALARDARAPELVRRHLRDPDALVRIFAAGGILAVAAAG